MYCSECGTEVEGGTSYCPECGFELGTQSSRGIKEDSINKAPCQKCDEDISTEAMRCPNCEWEPASSGILGSLLAIICLPWLGVGILLYLAAFGALFTGGYTILPFLGGLLFITVFTTFPATYLYALYKNSDRKPTEPIEIFGQEVG
jgi:RNA polymerase subunit RPABC4/transcription elongation factor Spt4